MSFHQQSWRQRFQVMGTEAEGVFEDEAPLGSLDRLGWDRTHIPLRRFSLKIRTLPDYACGTGHLVEVMGVGRDGIVKLKVSKWEGLKLWNRDDPVALFVWNSHTNRWALAYWEELKQLVAKARKAGIKSFANDGNEYFPIEWQWFEDDPAIVVRDRSHART